MEYKVVFSEVEVMKEVERLCSCDINGIIECMRGQSHEYIHSDDQGLHIHFYYLEYFYECYQKGIQLGDCFVLSSQPYDEYIFNELLQISDISNQVLIIVTKEVGRLFKENFNAKMNFKRNRRKYDG